MPASCAYRYGGLGGAALGWPVVLYWYFHPRLVCLHFVEKMEQLLNCD